MRINFLREQQKTEQIVDKMEQMKLELKMLESNDTSVAAIWKKKCLDLFEVCQTLKTENEELRGRCKELIVQGIQLADAIQGSGHTLQSGAQSELNRTELPKLRAPTAEEGTPVGFGRQYHTIATAGVTSDRHPSTAGTHEAVSTQMEFY